MPALAQAALSGPETAIVGGGVVAMLGWILWFSRHILQHQSDQEDRQNHVADLYLQATFDREARLTAEKDAAQLDARHARAEAAEVRRQRDDDVSRLNDDLRRCWEAHRERPPQRQRP